MITSPASTPSGKETMSPRQFFIGSDRRISTTLGAVILAAGCLLGGAGATFTFKANSEFKDAEHDRSLSDHEARIKTIEKDANDRLARLETKVDELLRRIAP